MKLYEISEQYKNLLSLVDDGDDLTSECINTTLDLINDEFNDKAIAISSLMKNMEADEKIISEHIKSMQAKKKVIEAKRQRLKDYLQDNMEKTGINEIESPLFKIKLVKSPVSCVIEDESQINKKYIKETIKVDIDKKSIIADGGALGARLEQKNHVRFY